MNMRHPLKYSLVMGLLLGTALTPGCASAQRHFERDSVRIRDNCRLATQAITTGHPYPLYDWAVTQIEFCEQSGPTMLGALWRQAQSGGDALARLVIVTEEFRDARMLDTMVAVARDASRPVDVRVAALRTLVGYHTPAALMPRAPWPTGADDGHCMLGHQTDFLAVDGAEVLDASSRPKILQALQTIGAEAGTVGDAARCAVTALSQG